MSNTSNNPLDAKSLEEIKNELISVNKELYEKNYELLKQRKRAELLLHSIVEAIIVVNKELKITLVNKAAEKLLTIEEGKVLGTEIKNFLDIFTRKGTRIPTENLINNGSDYIDDYLILKAGGVTYYVYIHTSEVFIEEERTEFLISIRDVTAEKELEKTKDDFISITSHELRTPMSIIKSYLWMLNSGKGGTLTDKQKEYLDKATKGTERMLNLINDMLNISKIEQGRMEMKVEILNLSEFANDVLADFKIKTEEKHIKLEIEIDKEIHIYADKSKLREVFINLVGNSLKFTEQGLITVSAEKSGENFITINVTDTGKGLEKSELDKLFHKFGRLDNSYQTVAESGGTGLGLYIVKLLVESMSGRVGVHSDGKAKGSTFWFTLPINNIQEKLKLNVDLAKIQAI